MFCPNCGSEVPQGAKFCGVCGSPIEDAGSAVQGGAAGTAAATGDKNGNKKKWAILGVIIAAAVVVIIVLCVTLGGGYKKPIKKYMKGVENFDAKEIVDAMAPFLYEAGGYSKSDFIWEVDSDIRYLAMDAESVDNFKLSYEIGNARDCGSYEISDLIDDLVRWYDLYASEIPNIKKVKRVDVDVTITYTDYGQRQEEADSMTVYVGKIGAKWYILDGE